ncbi:uncharacterized protein LOC114278268 [Camellia sinensis]|uniref:uncharacterized protein LOC114278268 n=1 Tax=Camellia sinensis TaxID=4442 RepID=UPI0010367728|nr:uncharacterized protein LOC114278268 [Camellia sinensis]
MKPPQFPGGLDPLKAEAWVLGIKKLFEVFPCLETRKVLLAIFTLEDETRRWWMLMHESNNDIGWARFLEIFYDKYFPQCVRDRKVSEFMGLKQDSMTVAEYEAKFTELARFAPHMVDIDYKKGRHFEGGLQDDILEKVNCGKRHHGVCYRISRACFKCGKTGHMARDCNQSSGKLVTSLTASIPKPGNTTRPITTVDTVRQMRVFALVLGDTRNTEAVVSGLNSIPIVNGFSDVFPDELSGELVDREIEFTIEVVPDTQPISKTPYRMTTAKMKELK